MEKIYKRAKAEIHRNAERIDSGLVNYIPFGMERFEEYVPGVQRKNYTIVTANSGIGKSKFTKCLYVIRPVEFIMEHPNLNIKLKIKYFCLEESKESFIQSIYAYMLYKRFNIRIPIKMLKSIGRVNGQMSSLPREVRAKVDALDDFFEIFEEFVEVIDDVRYPYGIYQNAEEWCEDNGLWKKKSVPVWDKASGSMIVKQVNDYYVPNNPDTYFEVITDHISKLYQPKGTTLHETIGTFSSKYSCELRDRYFATIINVQQQAADQEKKQFTHAGQSIISKLEPSLDGLGDNKTTQRDADEVIGLFSPARHEIAEHRGYKITSLDDNYRSVIQLKARDGHPNSRIGCYFDGAVNYFEELPAAKEMKQQPNLYEKYLRKCGRSEAPPQQGFDFGGGED